MTASGLGSFPAARRGRVLWAGLLDPEDGLAALARSLDESLATRFRAEIRGFTPHVTVARSEPPLALAEGWNASPVVSQPFTIRRLVLFQSHLGRPTPHYEPIGSFPLEG